MRFALFSIVAVGLALAACQNTLVEPTTPSDMFDSQSKPVGDSGDDPYRPDAAAPLITIPAGPPPGPRTVTTHPGR